MKVTGNVQVESTVADGDKVGIVARSVLFNIELDIKSCISAQLPGFDSRVFINLRLQPSTSWIPLNQQKEKLL